MLIFEVLQPFEEDLFWILCAAFLIAFLLAFSVGANDVSNSFGTSVGSRVLTVTQACILATVFEVAGATLLGYSVCDTFRRKMYDVDLYDGAQKELMLGALACLIGSALWNIVATALKMPISGTHSIVGATIGFSLVSRGWDSIRWVDMARIVASWFASPLLSGAISSLIYVLIYKTIINKVDPLKNGLKALPLFYGATIFINVASIVIDGPEVLGLNLLPWYAGLFISLVAACLAITCVATIMVPRLKREVLGELLISSKQSPSVGHTGGGGGGGGGSGGGGGGMSLAVLKSRSLEPAGTAAAAAYDNATFKADVAGASEESTDAESTRKRRAPRKPKRELSLDAGQLETDLQGVGSTGARGGSAPATSRPAVAPKPAHLRRPPAHGLDNQPGQQQQQQQLDEIDLTSGRDLETGPSPLPPPQKAPAPSSEPVHLFTFSGERYEVAKLFSSLQILTACFASFAHGTNDVSNAVAPLIPIWNIYTTGREDISESSQIWILAFGSIGICTGLWAWGRAVMATISDGLTKITPSRGFSIELGAAISVLVATKLGLPISTTHCKVGSLVIVGFVSSKFLSSDNSLVSSAQRMDEQRRRSEVGAAAGAAGVGQQLEIVDKKEETGDDSVDWKLFGNIAITWISTVPLAAGASALVMVLLRWLAL